MSDNIFKVFKIQDLQQVILDNYNKFIIMIVVRENISNSQAYDFKKFLKKYSQEYPNMLFIYYIINDDDMGKCSLPKHKSEYPSFEVITRKNILVEEKNVSKEGIYKQMNHKKLKEYFDKDKERYLEEKNEDVNIEDEEDNGADMENEEEYNAEEKPSQNPLMNNPNAMYNPPFDPSQVILEQKKLAEKIRILLKHAEENKIELMSDIAKRKKIEAEKKAEEREKLRKSR
uniref:Thioredoxin domain-containing protein n=1 Tax=viral metagenome TaxID=1070528 RepID=A0A6C0EEA5_9ZZZZ